MTTKNKFYKNQPWDKYYKYKVVLCNDNALRFFLPWF